MATKKQTTDNKKKAEPSIVIQNCDFTATKWDASVINTVSKVVDSIQDGLEATIIGLEALKNITDLFKNIEVKMDSMLHVNGGSAYIGHCKLHGGGKKDEKQLQ